MAQFWRVVSVRVVKNVQKKKSPKKAKEFQKKNPKNQDEIQKNCMAQFWKRFWRVVGVRIGKNVQLNQKSPQKTGKIQRISERSTKKIPQIRNKSQKFAWRNFGEWSVCGSAVTAESSLPSKFLLGLSSTQPAWLTPFDKFFLRDLFWIC